MYDQEIDDEGYEGYELPPTLWDKIKPFFKFLISPKFLVTLGILLVIYAVVWAVRPPKEEVFYKRGIIYSRRRLYNAAERELKLALNENPNYTKAQYELGLVNMTRGKHNEARDKYSKVIEIDSKIDHKDESLHQSEDTVLFKAYLGSALSYMTEEKFDKAEEQIQKAKELDDKNLDIYRIYGRLYEMKGEIEKARESYQKAIEISPESIDILLAIANGYWVEENFDEAKKSYLSILEKKPDNIIAHMRLGAIYERLEKDSDAEREYKKVLEIDPANGLSSISLARLYTKREELQKAIDELEKAIKGSPAFYSLYLELMTLYNRTGKYDSTIVLGDIAEKLLRNASMIHRRRSGEDPEIQKPEVYKTVKTTLYTNLGEAYFRTGDFRNASEVYKKLLQLHPDSPITLANLGTSYLRQNDPELLDKSTSAFEKSIKLGQNIVPSYIGLAELSLRKGNPTRALSYAKKAVEINPDDFRSHYFLATVYSAIGRDRDAIREYKRSIEISDSTPARVYLALVLRKLGKNEQALAQYEKALKLSPEDPIALNNLALLYLEKDQIEDALKFAQKAVKVRPDSPELQDTLGWIYYANGDYKRAVETLSKAQKKLQNIPEVLYHLGMAYYKSGEYDKAQESLEKVLQLNIKFENAEVVRKTLGKISDVKK